MREKGFDEALASAQKWALFLPISASLSLIGGIVGFFYEDAYALLDGYSAFVLSILKALGEGSFLKEGAIFLSIAVFLMSILLSFSLAKLRKRTVLGLPVCLALDFLLFALSYLFEREGGFLTPLAYFLGLVYHLARLVFALIFYLNYARVFRLSGIKHGKS